MRFNAQTECFELSAGELKSVAIFGLHALKQIRTLAGKTLDKYEYDTAVDHCEYAQQSVIAMAKAAGVNLGSEWGHEIDLRKV